MCKFTNHLFVFLLVGIGIELNSAAPTLRNIEDAEPLLNLFTQYHDRDLYYDQRQRGKENYLLKLDGFVVGLPEPEFNDYDIATLYDIDVLQGVKATKKSIALEATDDEFRKPDEHIIKDEEVSAVPEHAIDSGLDNNIVLEMLPPKKQENAEIRYDAEEELAPLQVDAITRAKIYLYYFLDLIRRIRGE